MFRSFLHSQNWAHFRWLSTFALSSKLTAAFRQLNNFVLIILKTKTTVASGIVQVNLRETLAEYFFPNFFSTTTISVAIGFSWKYIMVYYLWMRIRMWERGQLPTRQRSKCWWKMPCQTYKFLMRSKKSFKL